MIIDGSLVERRKGLIRHDIDQCGEICRLPGLTEERGIIMPEWRKNGCKRRDRSDRRNRILERVQMLIRDPTLSIDSFRRYLKNYVF